MGVMERFKGKIDKHIAEESTKYIKELNQNMQVLIEHMIQIEKNQCELGEKFDESKKQK